MDSACCTAMRAATANMQVPLAPGTLTTRSFATPAGSVSDMGTGRECDYCMAQKAAFVHDDMGYCLDCADEAIEEAEDSIGDTVTWIREMKEASDKARA